MPFVEHTWGTAAIRVVVGVALEALASRAGDFEVSGHFTLAREALGLGLVSADPAVHDGSRVVDEPARGGPIAARGAAEHFERIRLVHP